MAQASQAEAKMMGRGMELHLLLLSLSLVGAWISWSSEGEAPETEDPVLIWDLGDSAIQSIHFKSEKLKVKMSARKDKGGIDFLWAHSERVASAVQNDDAQKGATPIKKSFRVSRTGAQKALDGFKKLSAQRDLGVLSAEKLKSFKLDPPHAEINLESANESFSLSVGMQAHGANLRYVCLKERSCFVMKGGLIDDLKWADSRLYERNLFHATKKEITEINLECRNKKLGWKRPYDEKAADGVDNWKNSEKSTEVDSSINPQKWLNQIFRIRVVHYQDPETSFESYLRTELKTQDGKTRTIDLARDGEGEGSRYMARSEHSEVWVEMSNFLGKEMGEDIESLCGGREP